jgi:hypothetical protein
MKKNTFQKPKKGLNFFLTLFTIVFVTSLNAQTTILTIGSTGALTINSGGTLDVSGLELKPNTNYVINQIQVSKELTAADLGSGTESMDKVYTLDADIENFTGSVTYNYAESEMNDQTHDASMYIYDSSNSAWSEYLDTDPAEFIVTTAFDSPIQINKVTVGAPNSLSVDDAMPIGIKIYPNPSSSVINIDYPGDLQLILFNFLGQQLLSSSSKTLNISNLKQGTYILKIKDSKNTINNIKIIKQ